MSLNSKTYQLVERTPLYQISIEIIVAKNTRWKKVKYQSYLSIVNAIIVRMET